MQSCLALDNLECFFFISGWKLLSLERIQRYRPSPGKRTNTRRRSQCWSRSCNSRGKTFLNRNDILLLRAQDMASLVSEDEFKLKNLIWSVLILLKCCVLYFVFGNSHFKTCLLKVISCYICIIIICINILL